MPNHITNRITAEKHVLDSVVSDEKNEQTGESFQVFDFKKIIAPPDAISQEIIGSNIKTAAEIALGVIDFANRIEMPSDPLGGGMGLAAAAMHQINAMRQLAEGKMAKDFSDEEFESFVGFMRAYRTCGGLMDWYDWNIKMWGTKWNSYQFERVSDTVVTFQTAWSPPHPVIGRLNEKTKSRIVHEWADEDTGSNVGHRIYRGDCTLEKDDEYSRTKEGYELAFELCGGEEHYEWNGSEYVYKDEE